MTEMPNAEHDAAAWIRDCIGRYVASGENSLYPGGVHEPAWDEPLVGFSRGDDPLYQGFKDDIGPFYWTPPEIFAATFPDVQVKPDKLTTCPVSGEKLGEMGKPYVFTYQGQEVKLCCSGCKKDFHKEPAKYVKKIQDAAAAKK